MALHYRATVELDRLRGMLRGRARLERKIGLKRLFFLMRTQTRYRVEQQSHWNRAIVRKNVDSAAREHGTSWQHLRNDLARQNVTLLPRMQQTLAQYEPLAFRAMVELCASHIPPPPPPKTATVPDEVYTIMDPVDVAAAASASPLPAESMESSNNSSSSKDEEGSGITRTPSSHPSAKRELRESITRMLKAAGPLEPEIESKAPQSVEAWAEAWKEYDSVNAKKVDPDV